MFEIKRSSAIACLALFFLLAAAHVSFAQRVSGEQSAEKRIRLEFSIGFNTFNLSKVRHFYQENIDYYRSQNLPIEAQRNFSGNVLLGLNGLYRLNSRLVVGLGMRYTSSPAKSLYRDYAGELEVSGWVRMLTLEGIVQWNLQTSGHIRPFVGARGGLVMGYCQFKEAATSGSYPGLEGDYTIRGNDRGYTTEAYVGAARSMGSFYLQLQGGYRYAVVDGMDTLQGPLTMKFDLSGIIILATLGLPI